MPVADDIGLDSALENRRIAEMRRRLCEHKARLNRLIVQGLPTQVMEDSLRRMEAGLRASQERHCSPGSPARARVSASCLLRGSQPQTRRAALKIVATRGVKVIAAADPPGPLPAPTSRPTRWGCGRARCSSGR